MKTLIITRSDDNRCIETVSSALRARNIEPIRLNTDHYPDRIRLSSSYGQKERRILETEEGRFDLSDLTAVWYRRFNAGAGLPSSLGDTYSASLQETRRTLFGMIATLPCFHLDPLESVRATDHKELQLRRAVELGLDVPKTLITNDPAEVRAFYDIVGGDMITKMQHSFAIYRTGIENVVFTNVVGPDDLTDLEGLRYCPMTFQERLDKQLELRVTVVGQKVMSAAIDSQKRKDTAIDWRRDGMGLLDCWEAYELPADIESKLLKLTAQFGLNYAACDFILTPSGRHVFLEINAVGEFFWLEMAPGLPISESIADLLAGYAPRQIVDLADGSVDDVLAGNRSAQQPDARS
ncbi:MAG: MvdC/MvdD family ATP grasp protein [Pseudomonadota bacterium]